MVTVLLSVVLALAAVALTLVNVRLLQWIVYAWRDARDERRASDLVPQLAKAHAVIRGMKTRLAALEQEAARIGRYLWPY